MSDVREAWRGLMRSPVITVSAILCLALGLGATTAISSAIDRALIQAPPFQNPDRLVTVYRTAPQGNTWPFSVPNYLDLARMSKQLSSISALSFGTSLLTLPNDALQVSVLSVTGNLFPSLGVRAETGRLLTAADDAGTEGSVVVLSDALWRSHFGADPAIVGRNIHLDGRAVTVVGVAPKDFRIPRGGQVLTAQAWTPLRFTTGQRAERGSNYLQAMGRLAPGATVASAQAELARIYRDLAAIYPSDQGESVRVVPLQAEAVRAVQTPLLLTFGAVCIVLLIAITNVAALLLARGVERQRVTAIRAALGASRWAIIRPVLLEAGWLTAGGVILGLALAWVGVRTIGALAARRIPQVAGLALDWRVIAFAVALAAIAALACAIFPAWRSLSIDPQVALASGRGGGASRHQQRTLRTLVVAEVALSLVLIVGAGLVLKGFSRLVGSNPGFDPDPILTMQVTVASKAYPEPNGAIHRFLDPAVAAIDHVPGVTAAGSIQLLPYQNWGWNFNIRYDGQPNDNTTQYPLAEIRMVTPGFFGVTEQKLIAGRLLNASDDDRPGLGENVVVNQALIRRDFSTRNPIGARFYTGDTTHATIVGVVSDIRNIGPYNPPSPEVYATYLQGGEPFSTFPLMVRTRGNHPETVASAVRAAIRRVDPSAAVTDIRPMNDVIAASVGRPHFYLMLLATFAIVAGLLAVAGLYGVLSYAVAQRTRELGIRNALGSSRAGLMRLIARQGLGLVLIGVVVGLVGAAIVTRLLTGLLYGVSPLDPATWIAASLALIAAGLLATLLPSYRATRVNPLEAIREE